MRLIDADELPYSNIKTNEYGYVETTKTVVLEEDIANARTVQAIPVLEGMTNGNIIMTTYPGGDLHSKETEGDWWEISHPKKVCYEVNFQDLWFDEDWWNAPYKR